MHREKTCTFFTDSKCMATADDVIVPVNNSVSVHSAPPLLKKT
jgi:hypothetical protein